MSEMIERVAKAIAENQHLSWLYDERTCLMCDQKKLGIIREDLRKAARAAIEAMREPTDEMLWDGGEKIPNVVTDARPVWEAMIDASLR